MDTTLLDLCYHAITVEGTIHRVYVYTTKSKLENFEAINLGFFNGCQIIYGFETTDPQSGKISREKGVDSLLVADLIYHSAMKNCEIALVGARDNDYMYALRRAQDFGVSVGLFNIVETPTKELIDAADPLFRFQISATQLAGN